MTERAVPLRHAAMALFGPLVWAAHFIIIYVSESLLCRLIDARSHTFLLGGATVLALGAVLCDFYIQRRRLSAGGVEAFLSRVRTSLDSLSLLAIVFVAVAGLGLPACR